MSCSWGWGAHIRVEYLAMKKGQLLLPSLEVCEIPKLLTLDMLWRGSLYKMLVTSGSFHMEWVKK